MLKACSHCKFSVYELQDLKIYLFCFQNVCGLFNAVSLFYSRLPLEELDGEIEHPGAGEPDPSEVHSADKSLAVFCRVEAISTRHKQKTALKTILQKQETH